MSNKTRKKGKKGNRRAGNVNRRDRRARRTSTYYSRVLPERKLRRILDTSGPDAARAYADANGLGVILDRLTAAREAAGRARG